MDENNIHKVNHATTVLTFKDDISEIFLEIRDNQKTIINLQNKNSELFERAITYPMRLIETKKGK